MLEIRPTAVPGELTFDPQLFSEFFDWQPQAFVWLTPVWDDTHSEIVDFTYMYSNRQGLDYLKLRPDMLGEIRISNTPSLTDDLRPVVLNEMKHVYNSGETVEINMYNGVIDRYGTVYRIKFRGGVLTTIQDKTLEKKAIIELIAKTAELQASNKNLEEFAYAASHDLQEPLRKIEVLSSRVISDFDKLSPDENRLVIKKMQSAVTRMRTLVTDLLAYARTTVKPEVLAMVDLQALLKQVLQDIDASVEEAKAKIYCDELPVLPGDARQLQQMFLNLLSNALKYRRKDMPPEISIGCRKKHRNTVQSADTHLTATEYWEITIADNGIGFDPQHAEKIFQLFQRLHTRHEFEGTGIGLALVKKIVQNHKGFVAASSAAGAGATFTVYLPATQG